VDAVGAVARFVSKGESFLKASWECLCSSRSFTLDESDNHALAMTCAESGNAKSPTNKHCSWIASKVAPNGLGLISKHVDSSRNSVIGAGWADVNEIDLSLAYEYMLAICGGTSRMV
jgi:hypothetical protein